MRFSIGTKLWSGFLAILLMILIVGITSYQSTSRLVETAQWVSHTHLVLTRLAELVGAVQQAESAERIYLISGDERYLATYKDAVRDTGDVLSKLRILTVDNADQQRQLDRLAPLISDRLGVLQEAIELRRTKGLDAVVKQAPLERGIRVMEQVQRIIGEVERREQDLLDRREKAAQAGVRDAALTVGGAIVVSLLLVVGISLFLGAHIARPLTALTARAAEIAAGRIAAAPTSGRRGDEIGLLEVQFNQMAESLRDKAAMAQRIAEGDLRVQVQKASPDDVLGTAFEAMLANLREMSRELNEGVGVLAASANEILAGTTQIAAGATETASAMAETATTVEEVKQTAGLSSQKAKAVYESAQRAAQVALTGRKAVEESTAGMQHIREQMESIADSVVRLSEQGQAIGEIIASVNDLAEQSNLLAVNAAIEAAKAGEQGRGFAVVAQEVRSLAEQSRQATRQVRTILGDIQKATSGAVMAAEQGAKAVETGVRQSSQAGDAIRQMTESITESAQAASQIAVSAQQQLAGMDQLALATGNIKVSTAQNLDSSRQAEVTAQNLHALGQRLKLVVERYKG